MTDVIAAETNQALQEIRRRVDGWLDEYTATLDQTPDRLLEAIRYSLLAGGKRLRPALLILAAKACGGTIDDALPAGCALEMLHTYSLVHDDLPAMDDDDLRRGQPTCHVKFGESTAILVGDALLTLAFEVMSTAGPTGTISADCVRVLAQAAGCQHLIGGQFDDLAAENRQLTMEALEAIHRRKTATLFGAAAELGARLAGASVVQVNRLSEFGRLLGLSFQIQDDLLDVRGEEQRLGKRAQKDQSRGKSTYPGLIGIEASESKARQWIERAIEQLEPWQTEADPLRALAHGLLKRMS